MSGKSPEARFRPFAVVFLCLLALPAKAFAQAVIGTAEGSNQVIVFPSPSSGLPAPTQSPVAGFPPGFHQPFAVSFFAPDSCLVSDFGASRIFVVKISTRTVLSTISTVPFYDGTGTLAVAPGGNIALASGGSNQVAVITSPFGADSAITAVPLPGAIPNQTTQAIVFARTGRAFVYHQTGLSILDPP